MKPHQCSCVPTLALSSRACSRSELSGARSSSCTFLEQRAPRTAPSRSVQPKRRETNTCNDRAKRASTSLSISLSLAKMVNGPCVICINGQNRAELLFLEKKGAWPKALPVRLSAVLYKAVPKCRQGRSPKKGLPSLAMGRALPASAPRGLLPPTPYASAHGAGR